VPRHVIVTHGLPTARQNARQAVFSEGRGLRARIVRPCKWQGVAFPTGALRLGPRPNGGAMLCSPRCLSLRACGARPSAGRAIQGKMAYRGKVGDDAKCGFLGGTHSVRPPSMAKRVPRDSVFTRWPGGAGSPTGTCPGSSRSLPCGRAEPAPPRGRLSELGWLCGERPEITWRAVFSEGRGLRACRYMRSRMRSRTPSPLPRQLGPYFFSTRRAALGYI